eukprot:1731602-Rhodomonas_salina.2
MFGGAVRCDWERDQPQQRRQTPHENTPAPTRRRWGRLVFSPLPLPAPLPLSFPLHALPRRTASFSASSSTTGSMCVQYCLTKWIWRRTTLGFVLKLGLMWDGLLGVRAGGSLGART